jgi:hypothetical protein
MAKNINGFGQSRKRGLHRARNLKAIKPAARAKPMRFIPGEFILVRRFQPRHNAHTRWQAATPQFRIIPDNVTNNRRTPWKEESF